MYTYRSCRFCTPCCSLGPFYQECAVHSTPSFLCRALQNWPLAAPLGCRLSALGVDHAVRGVPCAAVLGFLPRNSKFVILPECRTLHFVLVENLTVPSLTCCPQDYPVVLWRLPHRDISRNSTRACTARSFRVQVWNIGDSDTTPCA